MRLTDEVQAFQAVRTELFRLFGVHRPSTACADWRIDKKDELLDKLGGESGQPCQQSLSLGVFFAEGLFG
jgi:hypothetical protein